MIAGIAELRVRADGRRVPEPRRPRRAERSSGADARRCGRSRSSSDSTGNSSSSSTTTDRCVFTVTDADAGSAPPRTRSATGEKTRNSTTAITGSAAAHRNHSRIARDRLCTTAMPAVERERDRRAAERPASRTTTGTRAECHQQTEPGDEREVQRPGGRAPHQPGDDDLDPEQDGDRHHRDHEREQHDVPPGHAAAGYEHVRRLPELVEQRLRYRGAAQRGELGARPRPASADSSGSTPSPLPVHQSLASRPSPVETRHGTGVVSLRSSCAEIGRWVRSGRVEDVTAEAGDVRAAGVAEVIESEEVLDAAQESVVVVRGGVDPPGPPSRGDDQCADAAAAEAR